MSIVKLTKDNFAAEVLQSDKPVLVDFWATWCGPCRMMAPVLEEIAAERNDIKIGKVDVDQNPELASQFKVMSIPTLIVFKNGQAVKTSVGFLPKEQLLAQLGL